MTKKDKPEQHISKWDDFSANDFEPFSGPITERYENGKKKEEGLYKEGKKTGKWTYYNQDGSIGETIEH
jgi:antitoxin component YwqK of YwqJK toxin-antitoxin module